MEISNPSHLLNQGLPGLNSCANGFSHMLFGLGSWDSNAFQGNGAVTMGLRSFLFVHPRLSTQLASSW